MKRLTSRERIALLTDSFDERDSGLSTTDPLGFEGYASQIERAKDETGLDEACVWGFADVDGERCALVVFDFAFLGGSMGMVVGEKVARAFDAAVEGRTPVVTVTASGGARMQEGMWALVQMAKTIAGHRRHADAGLPHVTLATSPTTGGVYASFASLADVVFAEPGATVGFAGPRVVEELTGHAPPADVHTAEHALAHGLIDAIVPRKDQRSTLSRTLTALRRVEQRPRHRQTIEHAATSTSPAWERVGAVRDPAWPKARDLLDAVLTDAIELRGDRTGAPDDRAVVVRAGRIAGLQSTAVAIGLDSSGDGRIRPEGFRKAVRAIALAGRLRLPLITLVDTRGADPLPLSESGGIAHAIATTFDAMLGCPSPTVAVVTGEGGSGGALALTVADAVLAFEGAVFSVIAPEGAAAILYRDSARAPELAEALRITAADLVELGLVDAVIPDPPTGVSAEPQAAEGALAREVVAQLERLVASTPRRRLRDRERRYRRIAAPKTASGRRKGR